MKFRIYKMEKTTHDQFYAAAAYNIGSFGERIKIF
jgi:hypothetical protein